MIRKLKMFGRLDDDTDQKRVKESWKIRFATRIGPRIGLSLRLHVSVPRGQYGFKFLHRVCNRGADLFQSSPLPRLSSLVRNSIYPCEYLFLSFLFFFLFARVLRSIQRCVRVHKDQPLRHSRAPTRFKVSFSSPRWGRRNEQPHGSSLLSSSSFSSLLSSPLPPRETRRIDVKGGRIKKMTYRGKRYPSFYFYSRCGARVVCGVGNVGRQRCQGSIRA